MELFKNPDERVVRSLLSDAKLPTEDITPGHLEHFFICGKPDDIDGVVGLELYGSVALLRSLAVATHARGRGIGQKLVAHAEAYARECGVSELYLLTNTAEIFFHSFGYERISRNVVPEAIKGTREYAGICPVSSAVMVKAL